MKYKRKCNFLLISTQPSLSVPSFKVEMRVPDIRQQRFILWNILTTTSLLNLAKDIK